METQSPDNFLDHLHENPSNSEERKDFTKKLQFIEKQKLENNSLPFRIKQLKEKGFIVRTGGLFAFVSFFYMPWKYNRVEAWSVLFPFIIEKVFFGKIHAIIYDPFKILLNGKIAQFKRFPIEENIVYKAVIIHKSKNDVLIEIGIHYDWKYGSYTGLIYRTHYESPEIFDKTIAGQVIQASYYGLNKDNQPIFSNNPDIKEWLTESIKQLMGKTVRVQIKKTFESDINYIVEGMHQGALSIPRRQYGENTSLVRKSLKYLENDEIIHCEVIKINLNKRIIHLEWNDKLEIETIYARKNL
jgi:hypothetical protein